MCELIIELGDKGGVVLIAGVGGLELADGVGQRLRDETATVYSEVTTGVRLLIGIQG